jgi:hypothetical protein
MPAISIPVELECTFESVAEVFDCSQAVLNAVRQCQAAKQRRLFWLLTKHSFALNRAVVKANSEYEQVQANIESVAGPDFVPSAHSVALGIGKAILGILQRHSHMSAWSRHFRTPTNARSVPTWMAKQGKGLAQAFATMEWPDFDALHAHMQLERSKAAYAWRPTSSADSPPTPPKKVIPLLAALKNPKNKNKTKKEVAMQQTEDDEKAADSLLRQQRRYQQSMNEWADKQRTNSGQS